ncbi:HlyD family type I secretion periplasmic adaptor subunit [Oculatella sp. LEGE 06141]|uniref:HlyD family type I secretion periplasmic adaptor subunit n=1 Tax=Oculatella sp. LEGE 06141 TaxID=1828648 RepID=UPI00187FA22D|nr:HlyD family type I secretion periplasmic adaptor subunit [Oculatella sp. LEGE 06141]MBE9181511.1 HlyD family type I secretion periplasmic adaptor subunit [Oculatella sp. LEGE 06141]
MQSTQTTTSARARQTRQQFVNPEDYLSYELGKAVRELPPLYTRLLAGSMTALVVSAIAWAYFSKVDEVAVANGELIPSAQVRPIRALEGGVIRSINVKEGEEVTQGDVLIEQDPTLSRSEVDRLEQSAALIRQDLARLEAERTGQRSSGNTLQDQLLASRLQEFDTRREGAIAEANRQKATIAEASVQLTRLQENLVNARTTLANAQDREQSLRSLVDGAIPRFDYLEARDRLTEAEDRVGSLQQEIAAQQQAVQQTQQAYQSAQQAVNRLGSERQSEILSQLNQRKEELANLEGQLAQAQIRNDGETIKAPISGRIYNIQATLAERTIEPGEELLSILPDGGGLMLQVKVLNRDIGFIDKGMRAKIKVATFPFQEFGTIEGEVVEVSPNAIVDQELGLVFITQVRLNKTSVPVRGQEVQLTPGMAASAEIVTRQRTVLTFLLEPITRRFDEAFSVR